ncbi:adhesion G protein-coupled receptor E5-like [Caloenas nicobarica]|uniref:adhesion G protein-coupled receptor E5-like n=1 Tax=Caloenas nicobarica TaxID=187106 RepID=UPI0032B75155
MCLEGLHLHLLLVRVFPPPWLRRRHLLLGGYGPPALLLLCAAPAFPGGYGTPRYCWLSLERGFRWSFLAPVCLVIAVNAVILIVTIWKLVQKFNDVNPDMGHLRKMRVLLLTGWGSCACWGRAGGWGWGWGRGCPARGGPPRPSPSSSAPSTDPRGFSSCCATAWGTPRSVSGTAPACAPAPSATPSSPVTPVTRGSRTSRRARSRAKPSHEDFWGGGGTPKITTHTHPPPRLPAAPSASAAPENKKLKNNKI